MTIEKALLITVAASTLTPAFNGDTFTEKFEALPQAVRETARAHMENAFPVSIGSTQGVQGWDYQINTRVDGKYHDLVIDENGKLMAVKDEIDLAALPAAAKAEIEKRASAAKIVSLEKVTEGSQISYGAVLRDEAHETTVDVRVASDGTLKSKGGNPPGK